MDPLLVNVGSSAELGGLSSGVVECDGSLAEPSAVHERLAVGAAGGLHGEDILGGWPLHTPDPVVPALLLQHTDVPYLKEPDLGICLP